MSDAMERARARARAKAASGLTAEELQRRVAEYEAYFGREFLVSLDPLLYDKLAAAKQVLEEAKAH